MSSNEEDEKLFDVMNDGLKNYKITESGKVYSSSGKVLTSSIVNGYEIVVLGTNKHAVHRLVAKTFIENKDKTKDKVNHINGDLSDNRVENLRWVTQKEAVATSKVDTSHPRRVLQLDLEGNVINTFDSVTEAGNAHNVSRSAISKACLGVNKSSSGFFWKFENSSHNHNEVDTSDAEPIHKYNNYYVFKDGRIYNDERKAFLKPILEKSGYAYVTLCKDQKKKNFKVHIIVANHYLEKPETTETLEVNHKNKIRHENNVENLEWVTKSENIKHAKASNTKLVEKSSNGSS